MQSLVQSQVKKVPEKVPGGFGAEPGQVQQGSEEGSGEGLGGFGAEPGQVQQGSGEGSGEGLGGLVQSQVRFNRICGYLTHGNPAEVFPALGFAAHFNMICKDKTLWLLGILQLIFLNKTLIRYNNFAITTGCDCLN